MTKKNKGITLIALVITIIVLLILAGVSISAVIGENGIATKAKNAATKTEEAKKEENAQLTVSELRLEAEAGDVDKVLEKIEVLQEENEEGDPESVLLKALELQLRAEKGEAWEIHEEILGMIKGISRTKEFVDLDAETITEIIFATLEYEGNYCEVEYKITTQMGDVLSEENLKSVDISNVKIVKEISKAEQVYASLVLNNSNLEVEIVSESHDDNPFIIKCDGIQYYMYTIQCEDKIGGEVYMTDKLEENT